MSVLEEIFQHKRQEVERRKELYPTKLLEQSPYFETPTVSLVQYIRRTDLSGVIAEIKRRSPSEGQLIRSFSVEEVSVGYMQAGASALSVLTDEKYFAGSNEDLTNARRYNFCPILRKDFVLDEYQIIEAKSIGADAILLIASSLSDSDVARLAGVAKGFGLEVVLEVHNEQELEAALAQDVDILGVNNRNLSDLSVDIDVSRKLAKRFPKDVCRISESGIDSADTIVELREHGYEGFLVGSSFMRTSLPHKACARLIEHLRRIEAKQS